MRPMSVPPLLKNIRRLDGFEEETINILQISPESKYCAIGSEQGNLKIFLVSDWSVVREYRAHESKRSLSWHPRITGALTVGSGNGDLVFIKLHEDKKDFIYLHHLKGFVHHVCFNEEGSQLAVSYEDKLAVLDMEGFDWGSEADIDQDGMGDEVEGENELDDDRVESDDDDVDEEGKGLNKNHLTIPAKSVIRGIHFVEDTIIVCFLAHGITIYSTKPPFQVVEKFVLRTDRESFIGASALSPSKNTLAVTNLVDGIDWFDVESRRYTRTTFYNVGSSRIVEIQFVGEEAVVAGHSEGTLILATCSYKQNPDKFVLLKGYWRTQFLATGYSDGRHIVVAASCGRKKGGPTSVAVVYEDNSQGQKKTIPDMTTTAKVLLGLVVVAALYLYLTDTEYPIPIPIPATDVILVTSTLTDIVSTTTTLTSTQTITNMEVSALTLTDTQTAVETKTQVVTQTNTVFMTVTDTQSTTTTLTSTRIITTSPETPQASSMGIVDNSPACLPPMAVNPWVAPRSPETITMWGMDTYTETFTRTRTLTMKEVATVIQKDATILPLIGSNQSTKNVFESASQFLLVFIAGAAIGAFLTWERYEWQKSDRNSGGDERDNPADESEEREEREEGEEREDSEDMTEDGGEENFREGVVVAETFSQMPGEDVVTEDQGTRPPDELVEAGMVTAEGREHRTSPHTHDSPHQQGDSGEEAQEDLGNKGKEGKEGRPVVMEPNLDEGKQAEEAKKGKSPAVGDTEKYRLWARGLGEAGMLDEESLAAASKRAFEAQFGREEVSGDAAVEGGGGQRTVEEPKGREEEQLKVAGKGKGRAKDDVQESTVDANAEKPHQRTGSLGPLATASGKVLERGQLTGSDEEEHPAMRILNRPRLPLEDEMLEAARHQMRMEKHRKMRRDLTQGKGEVVGGRESDYQEGEGEGSNDPMAAQPGVSARPSREQIPRIPPVTRAAPKLLMKPTPVPGPSARRVRGTKGEVVGRRDSEGEDEGGGTAASVIGQSSASSGRPGGQIPKLSPVARTATAKSIVKPTTTARGGGPANPTSTGSKKGLREDNK